MAAQDMDRMARGARARIRGEGRALAALDREALLVWGSILCVELD